MKWIVAYIGIEVPAGSIGLPVCVGVCVCVCVRMCLWVMGVCDVSELRTKRPTKPKKANRQPKTNLDSDRERARMRQRKTNTKKHFAIPSLSIA